jgi:hypothetical protein
VLNKSETGLLSMEEFMQVYEASELKWKTVKDNSGPWFCHVTSGPLRKFASEMNYFVRWRGFKVNSMIRGR